ncbi:MAG: ABC transporter ATP-binding protein [Anaerolineales bacterium]|nr:ABC transporter ATP-binding protein [Anaerolineales bacterium]
MCDLAIRVDNAVKTYAPRLQKPLTRLAAGEMRSVIALNHVSFDVACGEIFGLVGPNGSGKTTLVRLLARQIAPDSGQAALAGEAATVNGTGFFQKLSPVENLLYGARQYAGRPAETRQRVLALLARLGVAGAALYRPMEALSRGTQHKVAIARAFLAEPRVLLLDEPTTGLDPRARRDVQDFIRELRDAHGVTVLLTTHDMAEAERLCDRVAVVDGGRLIAVDTPAALKQRVAPQAGGTLEDVFLALTHDRRPAPGRDDPDGDAPTATPLVGSSGRA